MIYMLVMCLIHVYVVCGICVKYLQVVHAECAICVLCGDVCVCVCRMQFV